MESLAFTHYAVAYEDRSPAPQLRSLEELGLQLPNSAWLSLAAVAVVLSVMAAKPEAASAFPSYGSRGSSVVQIQQDLGIAADGYFGSQTYSAVTRFQSRNGLVADGVVGPRTASALGLSYAYIYGNYEGGYRPTGYRPTNGSGGTHYVGSRGLNVRSGPGVGYRIIGSLGRGASVSLTGSQVGRDGYTWGHLVGGGWIATNYL